MSGNTLSKPRVITCSLGGCFGCHMSLLDTDFEWLELLDRVDLGMSPLNDLRAIHACDIALIEGGVCHHEHIALLRQLRSASRVLIAVGACALTGGVPAMRNGMAVEDVLDTVYLRSPGMVHARIPNDPELPRLLPRVLPLHAVVPVDAMLTGCPPSAAAFMNILAAHLPALHRAHASEVLRYD